MEKVWNVWWQQKQKYLCEGQYIQINFRNCRCKCPQMQIPTLSAMVSLQNINTFFVALSNFTYFLFWQILNTSIVLLSNFPHSTSFLADSPHICHHLSHDLFFSWWGLSTTWPRHPRRSLPTLHLASFRIPSVWHHHFYAHLFWAQSMNSHN